MSLYEGVNYHNKRVRVWIFLFSMVQSLVQSDNFTLRDKQEAAAQVFTFSGFKQLCICKKIVFNEPDAPKF